MKLKQSNLIYHSQFDGTILKYQLKGWLGRVFSLLGFRHQLELPLNVVLNYRLKRRLCVFESFQFTVYHHNYLSNSKLKTSETGELLFYSFSPSSFSRLLQKSLDKSIKETKEGHNLGLLEVPIETIVSYYKADSIVDKENNKNDTKSLMVSRKAVSIYSLQKHVK